MKGTAIAGVLLIILGVAAMIYGGFNFSTKKNVVDAGPIQINKTEHHSVPIPPILGGVCVIGGIVLLVMGAKKS